MAPPTPRLTAVDDDLERRRRMRIPHIHARRPEPGILSAAALLVGLATVAASVAMVYLPAGLFVAGVELAASAIAYTRGATRIPAERPRRRRPGR